MTARLTIAAALAAALLHLTPAFVAPAVAATPQEKLDTCNFGADEKKLTGAARKSFIARCTADRDSPRGKSQAAKPKQTQ